MPLPNGSRGYQKYLKRYAMLDHRRCFCATITLVATANVTLPDGTTVIIEGSAEEVALLLERVSRTGAESASPRSIRPGGNRRSRGSLSRKQTTQRPPRSAAKGPADYIRELAANNFFETKRGLGQVKAKLEEQAHIYPVTHLSPALFRLVKSKELRRIKEEGQWKYVNP
jgi:hypothetical protein